jgi:hypothetical protein
MSNLGKVRDMHHHIQGAGQARDRIEANMTNPNTEDQKGDNSYNVSQP